ncbi:MAG TPA: OmpA family protein [Steroidobacteraceae bacterium]|jgi:outer membrane protein OmpA-like peptidoglycan-associated protein
MKRIASIVLTASIVAALGACATTPKGPIEELETARAIVPQVEASPRAGVAAENVSAARQSLERANKMATSGGKVDDIRYAAVVASRNAQIANEKILNVEAKEAVAKGEADRQTVILEARNREADQARERAASLEQELADMKAKKTDRGMVLTLGDVLFDTGKSKLKPSAYATIDRLASTLKESSGRKVQIEGHTDSVGSDELNQVLSQQRADSVAAALMERGVPSAQISASGKGEGFPVASNDTAGGRQQNRRVEMIFTDDASRVASDGT